MRDIGGGVWVVRGGSTGSVVAGSGIGTVEGGGRDRVTGDAGLGGSSGGLGMLCAGAGEWDGGGLANASLRDATIVTPSSVRAKGLLGEVSSSATVGWSFALES